MFNHFAGQNFQLTLSLDSLGDEVALKKFDPLLQDLIDRNQKLVEAHENYLTKPASTD